MWYNVILLKKKKNLWIYWWGFWRFVFIIVYMILYFGDRSIYSGKFYKLNVEMCVVCVNVLVLLKKYDNDFKRINLILFIVLLYIKYDIMFGKMWLLFYVLYKLYVFRLLFGLLL